ncbi:MAG TPA: VWA domain-containing protein, partial [Kofleriaceae bacterium]|nr:VWA domain-containing protein [Kofleriaceae bacterium]
ALLGGALMQPVLPYSQTEITSRGLDLVIALDLSSSMLEEMGRIRPVRTQQNLTFTTSDSAVAKREIKTRLTATKEAIKSLVSARRDDRIGLVVFSDNAYVISPLTFDHEYVVRYVDLIDDQLLRGEGMTAIGDGLALANHLLATAAARESGDRGPRAAERRNQVVVLFTDGENNKGRDPLEVLGESNAANIRVHMVGVDLEEEVRNKPQVQRVFQSVRRYGGRYFATSMHGGDKAAGILTSPEFTLEGPRITVLMSGGIEPAELHDQERGPGSEPWLRAELWIGGTLIRHASIADQPSERMQRFEWIVPEHIGKKAQLVFVDASTGSWGHLNVDEIWMWDSASDQPADGGTP